MFDDLEKLRQFLPKGDDLNKNLSEADNETSPNAENSTLLPQANLRIWLERQKGNRVATLVKGFEGETADLERLAKALKTHCGVGGTAKNGEIILQGDHREKVLVFLKTQGHQVKKAGG